MIRVHVVVCAAVVVLGLVHPAHALKPGAHAEITKASCASAGLPGDFCTRIATEDYDTDSREWDDLRAHAQIDDGETACTSADRTAARVYELAAGLRTQLGVVARTKSLSDVGATASAVGRALHTIQDNCAHHGMPNPQHAWASLSDFCDGTTLSPDIQDDALACARRESDAVMVVVAAAVNDAGVASVLGSKSCPPAPNQGSHNNGGPPAVCQGRFLPGPFDACSFFSRAKEWDGIDRRWENQVVVPALRAAFAAGLAGAAAPGPMCGGDERVLSPAVSDPMFDVSVGAPSCASASVFCLGKADDSVNPFADDPVVADGAGCSTAGGGSGGLLGVGLALALVRRRRQPTSR